MMEDILTSMRKQTECLDIKHENSWESEADFYHVSVHGSNGNPFNYDEHIPVQKEHEQGSTQETIPKNIFLINLKIGSKTIENVAIRHDCQLRNIAEELAENEMVKVVYFLQEKIKKGGNNCDASEAQVLVKLKPNWKWICIDELVEDVSMTLDEVFSDISDYFKPLFSLVPKVNRELEGGQPITNSQQSSAVLPLVSSTAQTAEQTSEAGSEIHGGGLITELRDLLAKHNVSELLKKDSSLEKDILTSLTSEVSCIQPSQDKVLDLKKYLCGLHTMLNSPIPNSPKPQVHQHHQLLQNNNAAANSCTNKQEKIHYEHCAGIQRQESYQQSSVQEILHEHSIAAAPLSRQRTVFDTIIEVPRLKEWYKEHSSPNKRTITHYVDELNASAFRSGKVPVTDKAVYIWFKNMRARKDKVSHLKNYKGETSEDHGKHLKYNKNIL